MIPSGGNVPLVAPRAKRRSANRAGLPSADLDANTLGVVLPVVVPDNLTSPQVYPLPRCTFGRFAVVSNPPGVRCAYSPLGPNPEVACLVPYEELPGGGRNFACTNTRNNRGFYLGITLGDGRAYNQVVRRFDSVIYRDRWNRRLIGSFYRLHQTRALAGGTGTGPGTRVCQEMISRRQLACLTTANPCSSRVWQSRCTGPSGHGRDPCSGNRGDSAEHPECVPESFPGLPPVATSLYQLRGRSEHPGERLGTAVDLPVQSCTAEPLELLRQPRSGQDRL